jgi:hypothetical protein
MQHILQNHTGSGKGPSLYFGDFTGIKSFNAATLSFGTLAPAQFQSAGSYALQMSFPGPLEFMGITAYIGIGQNGQKVSTNRLVVLANCRTVVTSYPVAP